MSLFAMFRPQAQSLDITNLWFFRRVADFIDYRLQEFQDELLFRFGALVSGILLVLLTIWIMWRGYQIVTGLSREPMLKFFADMAKATFIVSMAFAASTGGGGWVFDFLANDLPRVIGEAVTGSGGDPREAIDRNLGYMQLAMSSIDLLQTGGSQAMEDAKTRTMWFTGIGTAGPAVVGGAMLMLNKIALALFIGFSPFFILCLLFDYTKGLFQKWLFYGVGTMFSLAVLSAMVSIATEMVTRVAAYYWAGSLLSSLTGMSSEGLSSVALQQGGIGLILTVMLVSAPPMAAAFFNGVMGQFTGYNTFGTGVPAGARGPGSPPMQGQASGSTSRDRYDRDGEVRTGAVGATSDPRTLGVSQHVTGVPNDRVASPGDGSRGLAGSVSAQPLRTPAPPSQPPPPAAQPPARGS